MSKNKVNEKILAIDLGLKRIGIAFCADATIVTPLPAIERKNRNQASKAVKDLILEWGVTIVVMGIPMDGGETEAEMTRRTAHFMNLVDFEGKVFYQDESYSSLEAEALMKGEIRQKKDGRIDSLAAKIILERFLAENRLKIDS
ncbi:MAG: Holliday junction resolvase RuvX [Thiovulaceae bacterium]|nr:Holliday junction resolvase RuvX [Sulfurimonadaceae bacterium]